MAKKTKQAKRIARMLRDIKQPGHSCSTENNTHNLTGNDDQIKMSEILPLFAKPFIDEYVTTPHSFDAAIKYSIMVWNLGLLSEDQRPEYIELFQEGIQAAFGGSISREKNLEIMNMLLERKRTLFPDVKRLIKSYEIINKGDDSFINVESIKMDEIPRSGSAVS